MTPQVEKLLRTFTTGDLIAELRRRGRVRTVSNSTTYYNELSNDDRYMESIYADMVRAMAHALNNKLYIGCEDRVVARDADDRPIRTARHAAITVIVPEGVSTDDGS